MKQAMKTLNPLPLVTAIGALSLAQSQATNSPGKKTRQKGRS
jgi:hypothetical protein